LSFWAISQRRREKGSPIMSRVQESLVKRVLLSARRNLYWAQHEQAQSSIRDNCQDRQQRGTSRIHSSYEKPPQLRGWGNSSQDSNFSRCDLHSTSMRISSRGLNTHSNKSSSDLLPQGIITNILERLLRTAGWPSGLMTSDQIRDEDQYRA